MSGEPETTIPSTTPSTETGEGSPSLEIKTEDVNFAEFADGSDDSGDVVEPTGSKPPVTETPTPAAPAHSPASVAAPASTTPAPAAETPAAPPVATPEQAVVPPAPAPVPQTPPVETAPQEFDPIKLFEQARPGLEKHYALTPEEVELVRVSPDVALPQLAAKLHFGVQQAAIESLLTVLPQMLDRHYESRRTNEKLQDDFARAWPKLDLVKNKDMIINCVKSVKAANPKLTSDAVIKQAGLLAMVNLGLQPFEAPAAPPVVVPQVPPHRPAGAGSGGSPLAPRVTPDAVVNEFEALVRDDD